MFFYFPLNWCQSLELNQVLPLVFAVNTFNEIKMRFLWRIKLVRMVRVELTGSKRRLVPGQGGCQLPSYTLIWWGFHPPVPALRPTILKLVVVEGLEPSKV